LAPPPADRTAGEPPMTKAQFADAYAGGFLSTKRWLLSRGVGQDSAEEMAQAAWAKGWAARGQLRDPGLVSAWVNTIALNLLRRSFRRKDSAEILRDLSIQPAISPDRIDLTRTLAKCSRAEQTLLKKYYVEGYTSLELADQMGCTPVAVRVQLFRLRRRIASKATSAAGSILSQERKAG